MLDCQSPPNGTNIQQGTMFPPTRVLSRAALHANGIVLMITRRSTPGMSPDI